MPDEIQKLKIEVRDGEIQIYGNRSGLKFLADICMKLSNLPDKDASTGANHWHLEPAMNTAEAGSVPTIVWLDTNL
jgi:hypothetical protein